MAKKYYDGDITLTTDWGGDASTENLPVVGSKVQKVIKDSINSKVGYVGRVDKTGQGFYVLTRDEETFNAYLETITDENPFGDLMMDGINGRFDAPFNYKMNITLLNPENGYKSTLVGSTGNVIKFTAETRDANDTPQGESLTITFKVITEGGVENSYTAIYKPEVASAGIEYSLDGKLGVGQNTIVITAVGMNTGISAMRRITYRLIDMSFNDKFDITKRYAFSSDGRMSMNIGYALNGVGKTQIVWYFDGNLYRTTPIANNNPTLSNAVESFHFTEMSDSWLTPGVHNIQMSMICKDTTSNEEFQTPIYYREFIVEKTPSVLNEPYIVRKTSFDANYGFLANNEIPTLYNIKQFENATFEFAAYYNGKSDCTVSTHITYPSMDMVEVMSETLPLVSDSFSAIQKQTINAAETGLAEITLRAHYFASDEYRDTSYYAEISESDMNIVTVTDSVALSLRAFGRSNNTSNKDSWDYEYTDDYGIAQKVTTTFSKNEYVLISTENEFGEFIAPSDATVENTKVVDELPSIEEKDYKYVSYNNKHYVWTREFDWSNTSGWHDNKLKLANGNAITINYQPFSSDKLKELKERGGTYEFEFETTNVYNDDAVICRIAGTKNYAPGISIYASGAELVISREVVEPEYDEEGNQINENAGYIKAVSTKYKAEENNRISFVITPDGETNSDGTEYRNRILKIYVNGEICGAYPYDKGTNFGNDAFITFRGSEDACINISSIQIYKRALTSNEILNNYIYYRNSTIEKSEVYRRNDIMLANNDEAFDSDKLKAQLPVMMIYQIDPNQSLDNIHQEKKDKKLTRFFDVVYTDIQNPSKNFLIKNAYITPQGTSSMNYPVKNLRLYTGKKDKKTEEYYSRLFVGSDIFKDGSSTNLSWDNINLDSEVGKKRLYSFKDNAIPVNCWCLKADFAESSSSHNTGTARFWNNVLSINGLATKAQTKAAKHKWGETLKNGEVREYDVRTCVDGFPIVVFYQSLDGSAPRFEGKYNFNNDKSTESVFGFTGGDKIDDQEVKYFYIGKERPIVHGDACDIQSGAYTETPTTDSPLYASEILASYEKPVIDEETGEQAIDPETGELIFETIPTDENWYMLRGKELLDNPKMECWEILNSVNEVALFKTMKGFGTGDDDEKVGIVEGDNFDGAFESRFPDCGDYYHVNSLKRFGEWLVSCRYLDVDEKTGASVPFKNLPYENYHRNDEGKLSICSLTKQKGDKNGEFVFNFPGYNFYKEVDYNTIASNIKLEGYQQIEIKKDDIAEVEKIAKVVDELPEVKDTEFEYLKCGEYFYTWMPSNLLEVDVLPEVQEVAYDYVKVGDKYYLWSNKFKFVDFYKTQWVEDTAFNRALKFAVEKYDHIEMNKMAAYYIYLMRFGGVDQTVKNSMLTTEGPASDDPNSTLPSLWYFINYDNDTILGVKNDGRLVFDPYITRQTKDGTGYVYAGRESTLWNNLEEDTQFMEKVTEIDNVLAKGEANSLFALSYDNAIREYDINQSDKWCERIYNKDAERKYIQTYVEGWTQKVAASGTTTHVYEDYLYDVQGSRSAHRKWWLGRRFNVFDSRFCNTNFKNSLIKFRSTNLPAGSSFTIKSGEPIFYAWGHDNAITEMTSKAIQPGDTCTFTTKSAFNIGSYLEVMGSANISAFDLRDCVGALTEIDINGCYSHTVGTKMKEILVGDHTRTDLVNVSNTSLKFSGLDKASKLEILDMTNIQNAMAFDGLNTLLNIREVYAKGTSVANFTFADGAMIEKLELPVTTETLSLTRSSSIDYDNIIFEGDGYGKLINLTIDNCSKLMNNPDFVLNWIAKTPKAQRKNLSVNLQGINWTFDDTTLSKLFLLEEVGTSGMSERNIRGTIVLKDKINDEHAIRLQQIFGEDCFKEGSKVYIDAPAAIYINMPQTLWEGDSSVKCSIIAVGTTLGGKLSVVATVREILPDGSKDDMLITNTNGIITMDSSTLNNGYVTFLVKESNRTFEYLYTDAEYNAEDGMTYGNTTESTIEKRLYPDSITISTVEDSFNNSTENDMVLTYSPAIINNTELDGRGYFTVKWEMVSGTTDYEKNIMLHNTDKEIAQIQAPKGFDGLVTVKASVTRTFDNAVICETTKQLEFKNPNTIVTEISNKPLYDILVRAGIIEVVDGYGKLTKADASKLTMADLVDANKKSIFAGNTALKSFVEFEWFTGRKVGQMPVEGSDDVLTPNGMFSGCTNLTEIAFSDNFRYTANNMFAGCTKLEHIYGASQGRLDENNKLIYTSLGLEYVGDGFASGCTLLRTCNLASTVKYIGSDAFRKCQNLTTFNIPSNSELVMSYTTGSTPFAECPNITFTGTDYDNPGDVKFCVKDGACYEIKNNGTVALIHLGKDTLMSQIPTNKPVYACAWSMQNRSESDLIIPENLKFNGSYILRHSSGDSITFTSSFAYDITYNMLYNTNYQNYVLYPYETAIPDNTFSNVAVSGLNNIILPETITSIGKYAFNGCDALRHITLPSSLQQIGNNAFGGCSSLKDVYANYTDAFFITEDVFNGVMLENIWVLPEAYQSFKENLGQLFAPFVKPRYLHTTGELRIIKDGQIILPDGDNVITVGGINITDINGDYMYYATDGSNSDLTVTLNGVAIGEIDGVVTTIYTGDNSSLFTGDGLDFTYGVYDKSVAQAMDEAGWFYDKRFGGIRSKIVSRGTDTSLTFNIPAYADKTIPIVYGKFGYATKGTSTWALFRLYNSSGSQLLEVKDNGFNEIYNVKVSDGIITATYSQNAQTKTGIDGCVINKIGECVYSDPSLTPVSLMSLDDMESNVNFITVTLTAEQNIPNNVVVTVTDNTRHVYRKLWYGEPLVFIVPKGIEYDVFVSDFISETGKHFNAPSKCKMSNGEVVFTYTTTTGMTLKDDVITYSTPYDDYFIYTKRYNDIWSNDSVTIDAINVDEIFTSSADGFVNTKNVLNANIDSPMFKTVKECKVFDSTVEPYIPSYTDYEIVSECLTEVNEMLANNRKETIDFSNCWTSEALNETDAWTSDGVNLPKSTVCGYYIFGKRITC